MFTRRRTTPCLVGIVSAALAFALAGCGSGGSAGDVGTGSGAPIATKSDSAVAALVPSAVRQRGVLRVATEAQYAPMEFHDAKTDKIIGFDADIIRAVGGVMGLKVQLTDSKFDSIIPSLAGGRYDVGISAFGITAEREKQVDFVSYIRAGTRAMVAQGNPHHLALDKLCGVKTAMLQGSTQQTVVLPVLNANCHKAGQPNVSAQILPGSGNLPLALSSGRAEAVLSDGVTLSYIAARQAPGQFELAPGSADEALWGIASGKSAGMAKPLQAALAKIMSDGTYAKILKRWDMDDIAISKPTINPHVVG